MEAELDALETPVLKEVTLEVYKGLIERMLATLPEKERDDFARVHSVQFLNELREKVIKRLRRAHKEANARVEEANAAAEKASLADCQAVDPSDINLRKAALQLERAQKLSEAGRVIMRALLDVEEMIQTGLGFKLTRSEGDYFGLLTLAKVASRFLSAARDSMNDAALPTEADLPFVPGVPDLPCFS